MIQLPSSKLQQAQSHNEDWGKRLRDPPPEGRWIRSPLAFPCSPAPSTERELAKERREEEGWLSLSCVTLLTIVFLLCLRAAVDCCQLFIASSPVPSLAFSVLDLHENYVEGKSFMCHIHSLQHILIIALCLNFLNYSTPPHTHRHTPPTHHPCVGRKMYFAF